MQTILYQLRVDSVKTQALDNGLQATSRIPSIVKGVNANLVLDLYDQDLLPLVISAYDSFDFVLANDWLTETPTTVHITDNISIVNNQIIIPLIDFTTTALDSLLANSEEITIGAELAGFNTGVDDPQFLIQFDLKVRNRRGTTKPDSNTLPFTITSNFVLDNIDIETLPIGRFKIASYTNEPTSISITIGTDVITDTVPLNNLSIIKEYNTIYLLKTEV